MSEPSTNLHLHPPTTHIGTSVVKHYDESRRSKRRATKEFEVPTHVTIYPETVVLAFDGRKECLSRKEWDTSHTEDQSGLIISPKNPEGLGTARPIQYTVRLQQ